MNKCSYGLVLYLSVLLSARLTMAIGGFEMELLMTKLDYLQDKLQEVEQTTKSSLKETEHRIQEKLTKQENSINEKIETIEAKINEMENSLKKSVIELKKLGENKKGLDVLTNLETEHSLQEKLTKHENNINEKIETIEDMMIEMEDFLEKGVTELKKLGENKKTLDILTNSVRNIEMQATLHTTLLHFIRRFGGGWIVIQHRFDGSVDFYRNWTEYRNGFGNAMDVNAEFWLGLENVHHITKNRPLELLVELKDFYGNYKFAKYDGFEIGSESEKYALKKLGKYIGIAGDAMGIHLNQKFSTFDRDNDVDNRNCAEEFQGAWWYVNCHRSNLNGRYQNTQNDGRAMMWYHFKNDLRGLSYSRMMVRAYIK